MDALTELQALVAENNVVVEGMTELAVEALNALLDFAEAAVERGEHQLAMQAITASDLGRAKLELLLPPSTAKP